MSQTRKTRRAITQHTGCRRVAETEEIGGHFHVGPRRSAAHETGTLRGEGGHPDHDVVVTFTRQQNEIVHQVLDQGEGVAPIGTRGTLPAAAGGGGGTEKAGLLRTSEFRGAGGT